MRPRFPKRVAFPHQLRLFRVESKVYGVGFCSGEGDREIEKRLIRNEEGAAAVLERGESLQRTVIDTCARSNAFQRGGLETPGVSAVLLNPQVFACCVKNLFCRVENGWVQWVSPLYVSDERYFSALIALDLRPVLPRAPQVAGVDELFETFEFAVEVSHFAAACTSFREEQKLDALCWFAEGIAAPPGPVGTSLELIFRHASE